MPKLQKKPKHILLTKEFSEELEYLSKVLLQTQKERRGILNLQIPFPYSVGDELEFRYKEFTRLSLLCHIIINQYVPEAERMKYRHELLLSPLQILIQNTDRAKLERISHTMKIYIDDLALGP